MLGSISPVGEASRNQRWWVTATAHAVASTLAGATVGAVLGGAGALLVAGLAPATRLVLLAAGVLIGVAMDVGFLGLRTPSWHRQVDERWLGAYRGWVYGAGFGAQLGVGVATVVTSAATYAALLAAALAASSPAGLAIGATFGGARALPLLLTAGVRTPRRLYAVTRRLARAEPGMHRLTVVAQGALAATALLAALSA